MDRTLLDHEVILRAALAQHAKELERAHRKLAVTAMKVSLSAKDKSLVMSALATANSCSYYAAGSADAAEWQLSAAKEKYDKNAAARAQKRRRCEESDCEPSAGHAESAETKKSA